jgi:hypothetical protein
MKNAAHICETTRQRLNFSRNPAAETEIERHALSCPNCARFLNEQRQFKKLLQRAVGSQEAPASLRNSIRQMIRQEI